MGLNSANKLIKNHRKFMWKDDRFKKRKLKLFAKSDPIEGKAQAKGLVISKVAVPSNSGSKYPAACTCNPNLAMELLPWIKPTIFLPNLIYSSVDRM